MYRGPIAPTPLMDGFRVALARARVRVGLTQLQAGIELEKTMGPDAPICRRTECEQWAGKIERSMKVLPEIEVMNEVLRLYRTTWRALLIEAGVPEELVG